METIEHNGYTIEISQDTDCINPRVDYDNLSTFAFFHRNYSNESNIRTNDFSSLAQIRKHIEKELNAICIPVFLYSHSGDCIKACESNPFHCPWDSGQLGFAYVTKEKVYKEYQWKVITKKRKKQILEVLKGEVETFNQYINGEVYGYTITKEDEEVDSCWGYFGYDYCLEEAKNISDYFAKSI